MKKFRKNKKGFTLVEVIVVLVILAILIAIAVPSVMKYIDDANEAKYLAEARAVYVAAEAEVTKDYADDRNLNGSIYGTDETIETEVEKAVGFPVDSITVNPKLEEGLNPNDIESYTVVFTSPSSKEEGIKVLINKNGTAELQ